MTSAGQSRALRLLAAAALPSALTAAACASTAEPTSSDSLPPPAPAATSPAATASCRTGELKVSLGPGGVAAGTWAALLEFTDTGAAACTMTGWAAVAGITAAGTTAPATNRTGSMDGLDASGVPHVTLQPNGKAGIDISGADNAPGGGPCPAAYSKLRVSAPGDSASVTVSASPAEFSGGLPCCGAITASPVHPLSDFSFGGQ